MILFYIRVAPIILMICVKYGWIIRQGLQSSGQQYKQWGKTLFDYSSGLGTPGSVPVSVTLADLRLFLGLFLSKVVGST